MDKHPYENAPNHQFWARSIANHPYEQVDPVIAAKFTIRRTDKIVTAGSCFAQHIARHLVKNGFRYFVTEEPPAWLPSRIAQRFNYGVFSARYANVYTARQLLQLLRRAFAVFQPGEDVWYTSDGRMIDPFRPMIQPNGFPSEGEYHGSRQAHFAAVRQAVEGLDVFIFTLGLTEAWSHVEDGAVYPVCPGVAGGSFDNAKYRFENFRVQEVIADLRAAIDFIAAKNPRARFILTVSPVPLVATAVNQSVLVSTTYSKSVLRVAAQELADTYESVAYFPSYEIIVGNFNRGRYFAENLRDVTEEGVNHVMKLFLRHYADPNIDAAQETSQDVLAEDSARLELMTAMATVCEEEALGK